MLLDAGREGKVGSAGEYDWYGVTNTFFWVDPEQELIGLVWAQCSLPAAYYPLVLEVKRLVHEALVP